MTYRERREAKADRLREWAAKREAKAQALRASTPDSLRHDWAFVTQPGHIPERARMIARDDRAYENHQNGEEMASMAAGIEGQLEHAIYSDDPDAIQALETRIASLEAERDRIKRYNASVRAGKRDGSILTASQQAELLSVLRVAPYESRNGEFPAYGLTNLSGSINRQKKRLAMLMTTRRE